MLKAQGEKMSIPSTEFIYFFVIFLILYYILPKKFQNILLLLGSFYFYISIQSEFFVLLVFGIIFTYFISRLLFKQKRKLYLILGLIYHIGILFVFKYFNFFSMNIFRILKSFEIVKDPYLLKFGLPIGISFYTFEAMSFLIDIYRDKIKSADLIEIAMYLSFFPTILSGPIERFNNLKEQFAIEREFDFEILKSGFFLFIIGATKKVGIANVLSNITKPVFESPEFYSGWPILITAICFTFQIYYDFSGYSDMARGISKMLGIKVMENFKSPYFSKSIPEFWRRWHISLSTWFRDYVYFPLGGSRVSKWRKYFNYMVVFVLSGLWHGAANTFIIWGIYYGILMAFSDIKRNIFKNDFFEKINRIIGPVFVFILSTIGWIIFNSGSVSDAVLMMSSTFKNLGIYPIDFIDAVGFSKIRILELLILMSLIAFLNNSADKKGIFVEDFLMQKPFVLRILIMYIFIFITLMFGGYGYEETTEFIYFQF